MEDVEKIFSDYLETFESDKMFNEYFHFIRCAFMAGYKAAGGQLPSPQPVVKLIYHDELTQHS